MNGTVMGFDHCHFARIKDAGTTWNAGGADWQFVEDPLNLMAVTDDTSRPVIEDALPGSRFAFCVNNTATYMDPDSLYGDVDIVARIYDRFGQAIPGYPDWEKLNPYRIDYAIKGQSVSQAQCISFLFGHLLDGDNTDLVDAVFKQDAICMTYGDYDYRAVLLYRDQYRRRHSLWKRPIPAAAWHTTSFANGQYWVVVYAADQYGNTTADSQLVTINNPDGVEGSPGSTVLTAAALCAFPSPTTGPVNIKYSIPWTMQVTVQVFNLCGQVVRTLKQGGCSAGDHSIFWDGRMADGRRVPNGVYIVRLDCQAGQILEKLVVMR